MWECGAQKSPGLWRPDSWKHLWDLLRKCPPLSSPMCLGFKVRLKPSKQASPESAGRTLSREQWREEQSKLQFCRLSSVTTGLDSISISCHRKVYTVTELSGWSQRPFSLSDPGARRKWKNVKTSTERKNARNSKLL